MLTNSTERHLTSPLGDTRERPVPCQVCRRPTANICARCNSHCTHTPVLEATLKQHGIHVPEQRTVDGEIIAENP